MNFPKAQTDILQLANRMCNGFQHHPADFPNVNRLPLHIKRLLFIFANKTFAKARADALLATKAKQKSLEALKQIMKSCIKKATVDTAANPEKLTEIGWAPKAAPQSVALPKAPRNLAIEVCERATVKLSWDRPATGSGGPVRTYVIERREQTEAGGEFGSWVQVGVALKSEALLMNQPRGIQLEYHIRATNTGGESVSSNTVAMIL